MSSSASKRKPTRRKPPQSPGRRVQQDPDALTPAQEYFVRCYVANGGNGTRAYLESHPKANNPTAAREAWRLLRMPKIRAEVDARRGERFKRLEMEGDEAVALLAMRARADIADAFDDAGKLLPVEQWPESLRLCVKEVDGEKVRLHDALKAAELVAVATGRLRSAVDVLHRFDHVKHLAGTDVPPPAPEESE